MSCRRSEGDREDGRKVIGKTVERLIGKTEERLSYVNFKMNRL